MTRSILFPKLIILGLTVVSLPPLALAQEAEMVASAEYQADPYATDAAMPAPVSGADCARLAAEAGAAEGIPDGLLPAISLVETGHSDGQGGRAPWPWTLNKGGESHFLDSPEQALATLDEILATGTTNVDVGCMQLNWKWHSQAFPTKADMMDPVQNTAYAARFLKELYNQLGTWELATAAYHSTDPQRGKDYVMKVAAAQEAMVGLMETYANAAPDSGLGVTPPVMLSAMPMQLQGILALSGSPLFEQATARAALISRGGQQSADPDAPPPAFAPGEDDPDLPLVEADPAEPAPRRDPPDLPMVLAATESSVSDFDHAPRRLKGRWSEVEEMRRILAGDP